MQVGGLTIKQVKVTGLYKKQVKETESLVKGPAGTNGGNSAVPVSMRHRSVSISCCQ